MQIGVPPEDKGQGATGDPGEAGPVDVAHRKEVDTRSADELFLPLVQAADTYQRDPVGPDHWREVADARQLGRLGAEQCGQWHPMDIAADGG